MVFAKSEKRCNSKVNGGSIGREQGARKQSKGNQRLSAFCLICLPCFPSSPISFRWAPVAEVFLDIGKCHKSTLYLTPPSPNKNCPNRYDHCDIRSATLKSQMVYLQEKADDTFIPHVLYTLNWTTAWHSKSSHFLSASRLAECVISPVSRL